MVDPRRWVTLIALLLAARTAAAEPTAVVGAPGVPAERVGAAERAFADRGVAIVTPSAPAESLGDLRAAARKRVADAIQRAGDDYLGERYADGAAVLAEVEASDLALLLGTEAGRALLVQLNLWIGALDVAGGDRDAAGRRFGLALALDENARLDPAVWPPDHVEVFERRRAGKPPTGTAVIEVGTGPARVEIDGREATGDRAVALAVGDHYVYVWRPGRGRWGTRFAVAAGGVATIQVAAGGASPAELADDAATAMAVWFERDAAVAVRAVAAGSGAQRVAVVGADAIAVYDAAGRRVARARGASVVEIVEAVLRSPGGPGSPPAGADSRPIYEKWWFWAAAGAVVVAGGVGIYMAASEDDTLRGRFSRPVLATGVDLE